MKGWKTKTGAIAIALGGVLAASHGSCPIAEWQQWIKWIGDLLMAIGGALAAVGLGAKIDRVK